MRWTPGGRSGNLEDRRGMSGGGLGGIPKLGIGGFLILLILSFIFRTNFFALVGGGGSAPVRSGPVQSTPAEERQVEMVSDVLDDAQATWAEIFRQSGKTYQPATLVLFRDATPSGCGTGQAAMGPFYCPVDQKVYIDLSFYDELQSRFGAPGEFAQAYVIGHELGHHVQNLLGISDQVRSAQQEDPRHANQLSVALELQADCLAGVWAHSTQSGELQSDKDIALDPGDIDQGLTAAAAVGDDRIQSQATGRTNPETWTHGSSEERASWFRNGYETGDIDRCNTFESR
jgi:uncharacterized protein